MDNQLESIYNLLRKKLNPSDRDMNILFYTLGTILCSVLLFTDKKDPLSYQYILATIGMIMIFILLVYNSIKAVPPLKLFLKLPITKFIITIFLSGYIIFSAAEVSIIINSIFKISSSNFRVSSSYGTFLFFLNHLVDIFLWYMLIVSFGLFISYVFEVFVNEKDEFGKTTKYLNLTWNDKCWYLIVFVVFIIGLFHYKNIVLQEESLKYKIFRIALHYDFDSNHLCSNIDQNYSILYIGGQQTKVLVNFKYDEKFSNFEEFMTADGKNIMKNALNFYTDNCIYNRPLAEVKK